LQEFAKLPHVFHSHSLLVINIWFNHGDGRKFYLAQLQHSKRDNHS